MISRDCPFPGMDPWLEQEWHPFHQGFVVFAAGLLNDVLPDNYAATIDGRVFVDRGLEDGRNVGPDIRITGRRVRAEQPADSAVAVMDPILVDLSDLEVSENFIKIIDTKDAHRVVCMIELLSRSNKRLGAGRNLYLKKQKETLASDTALLEIDLLRHGRPATVVSRRREPLAMYHACVSVPWKRSVGQYYPIHLREPLPTIGVPLRQGEPPCPLDLQAVFSETFRRGRHGPTTDYTALPVPPLSDVDAAWAKAMVSEASSSHSERPNAG